MKVAAPPSVWPWPARAGLSRPSTVAVRVVVVQPPRIVSPETDAEFELALGLAAVVIQPSLGRPTMVYA